jgi:hypothetical protein
MDEENKNVETDVSVETNEEKQTFTLEEVQKLLNAKNYEKDQRKQLANENKTLKEEIAKLKGNESVEKFKEDEFESLKQQLAELQNEKEGLLKMQAQNELKDALRTFKGILPEALDDVLEKALKAGFKKTEVGYLDVNGKTLENFFEGLKSTHSYYFGISSNKNIIPEALQKQIDNAKKTGNTLGMLQEAFKGINLRELK